MVIARLPHRKLVDLAELMVDTVAMADWSFFAKNGGDTTMFALMVARAATGRPKVVITRGGYHGVAPWTQKSGHPGITSEDVANNLYVEFGDFEGLERVFAEHRGTIACFMATPYHHPVFETNRLPPTGYWNKVRELCTREGVVLAIDDVRCGFRLDVRGSDAHYGFEADLECFCKALANGWNISSLCGKDSAQGRGGISDVHGLLLAIRSTYSGGSRLRYKDEEDRRSQSLHREGQEADHGTRERQAPWLRSYNFWGTVHVVHEHGK
ncbi:hypothetical protein MASR2M48_31100 [Spirochaetota bacterium]